LLALALLGCGTPRDGSGSRVVLYCALDREFADDVLADFTRKAGLDVAPRYDTEANKSVSLCEDLVREAARPRCDVHWNNEILGTIRLQKQGILEPYASPSAAAYPAAFKAKDHTWHAFAARARVLLVNTKLVPADRRPAGLAELTGPRWRGRVAMAKPQFGTSATQAACLFQAWGAAKARAWYRGLRANGVHVEPGNKQVAEGVGRGQYAVGLTDTDDAVAEVEAGNPVAIVYPDRDAPAGSGRGTLFIPNTVAVVRGCPNPEGARQLVDYLLSAEVEGKLARSASRQIPLNPEVRAQLPREIETPRTVRALPVDFERAADRWDEVQEFLAREFARP
jgi:iron(III) transport system substrate-binding protein